ncbi:unnamed protein product [Calypogeia fissa]
MVGQIGGNWKRTGLRQETGHLSPRPKEPEESCFTSSLDVSSYIPRHEQEAVAKAKEEEEEEAEVESNGEVKLKSGNAKDTSTCWLKTYLGKQLKGKLTRMTNYYFKGRGLMKNDIDGRPEHLKY